MTVALDEIVGSLVALEASIEREKGVVESVASRCVKASQLASEAEERALVYEEASKFLAEFADERQEQVLETMQDIASIGLTQIFGEPMELKIEQVVRAKRVEMDITIKTGDLETPIMEARGGGLAAVAGFLLRVSVLLLTPGARRLMVLDESFAMLSEEYVPRMSEFLSELYERTGLQVVLVTHQPEFAEAADSVFRIEKSGVNTSKLVKER